jgi:hypothetical protein
MQPQQQPQQQQQQQQRTCCPWMVLDAAPLCSLPVGLLYSTSATVMLALHTHRRKQQQQQQR